MLALCKRLRNEYNIGRSRAPPPPRQSPLCAACPRKFTDPHCFCQSRYSCRHERHLHGRGLVRALTASAPCRKTLRLVSSLWICRLTFFDLLLPTRSEFLIKNEALPEGRIRAIETGGCPHAAIRCAPRVALPRYAAPLIRLLRSFSLRDPRQGRHLGQPRRARAAPDRLWVRAPARRVRRRQPRRQLFARARRLHHLRRASGSSSFTFF